MPAIFPGMDPYLEHPQLWSGVHSALIVYFRDQLNPLLRPRYIAAIEERVFVEGPERRIVPDLWVRKSGRRGPSQLEREDDGGVAVAVATEVEVDTQDEPVVIEAPELEIHESHIEILDLHSNKRLVTVIEVVSPTNKAPGPGRDSYLAKQAEVLGSPVHLVEIDLLRTGLHVMSVPEELALERCEYDYLACVNRSHGRRAPLRSLAAEAPSTAPACSDPPGRGGRRRPARRSVRDPQADRTGRVRGPHRLHPALRAAAVGRVAVVSGRADRRRARFAGRFVTLLGFLEPFTQSLRLPIEWRR